VSVQDPGRGREETRLRILSVARELFGSAGFDATTVRQIAKHVGMTDAALYYHFRSKREILTSLWMVPVGGGVERLKPLGPMTAEQLDKITDAAIDFSAANDHILRLMCREALGGDQTAMALRLENRAFLRRALQEHLGTIVEPGQADLRTEAIVALITGMTMRTQIERGARYRKIAGSRAFRQRIRAWVRSLARLDEAEAS
jgi:AcrR family transcriptional regulator